MLELISPRPSQALPASLLTIPATPPASVPSADGSLRLLPKSVGSVAEIRAGAVAVHADETIYAISEPRTNQLLYVGLTAEPLRERLRKHCSKRKPRKDIGAFSRVCEGAPGLDRWRVAAAPPVFYLPFVIDALAGVRDRLAEEGALKPSLAARIDALLADPARWARYASVVEWCLIAAAGPEANAKGDCYVETNGLVSRLEALLKAFSRIVAKAERRRANAFLAA